MGRKTHHPAPVNPEFYERFHAACRKQGIFNQADLMRALKINRQTAHKWWHGMTDPENMRASDGFRIADGLNISMRWLLKGGPEGMAQRPQITTDQFRVLEIYDQFGEDHAQWRDDWVSDGVRRLELLGRRTQIPATETQPTTLHQPQSKYRKR